MAVAVSTSILTSEHLAASAYNMLTPISLARAKVVTPRRPKKAMNSLLIEWNGMAPACTVQCYLFGLQLSIASDHRFYISVGPGTRRIGKQLCCSL